MVSPSPLLSMLSRLWIWLRHRSLFLPVRYIKYDLPYLVASFARISLLSHVTAPLWTAVLNKFYSSDNWYLSDTVSCVVCLLGMISINHPAFSLGPASRSFIQLLCGMAAALLSAITAAGVNISIRKLKKESTAIITLYAMVGSILVAFPGFIYHLVKEKDHTLRTASSLIIFQLCLTGFLSWMAQMSKTAGLQMSKDVVSVTATQCNPVPRPSFHNLYGGIVWSSVMMGGGNGRVVS